MKALGVDIGTSTISAAVLDRKDASVIAAKTLENKCFLDTGNDWERIQDADRIMEKALALAGDMLDRYEDIESIGLTGQMHGIVYIDRDGNAVSPLYTWQDARADLPGANHESLVDEIRRKVSVPSAGGYGLATHIYNRRHGLVPENAVSFCTIADYLGMKLTGRTKALVHAGNAASMGFFDVLKGDFQKEALAAFGDGRDLEMLPETRESFDRLGSFRGRPVTLALGDNQASFLGSVGIVENGLLVNMGTGGQISLLSDQYFTAPGIEARPFVPGKYLLAGSSLCGGRAYAILERFFSSFASAVGAREGSCYDVMGELARQGRALKDPMRAVTAYSGSRIDPSIRGSFSNISEDNFTPASMTYAVLRGMADELYRMYELIRNGTGIEAKLMVASGNGLRMNPVLQEIFSEVFQIPLNLSSCREEAACGAAVSSYIRV